MFQQFPEDAVPLRTPAGGRFVVDQLCGQFGRQRHEVVAVCDGCVAKILKRFERVIVGAKPERGVVGFFVRERLQEVGPKRWVVADDGVGV